MANASPVFRSPTNPHSFKRLFPGFQGHLKMSVKFFLEHMEGKHEGMTVSLRTDMSEITWKVKMEEDIFTEGWKEFVEAHDLQIDDYLHFRHQGDMLFHVTVLRVCCCHEEDKEKGETEISSRSEKEVEETLETESDRSSSDLDCFSQSVTASKLSRDEVSVPLDFAKRNGLKEGRQEIVLMNEEGNSWPSVLKSWSSRFYIFRGWTRFCTENKLEVGDSCTFRLLRNTETLVFQLCSRTKAERMKKILVAEDHVDDKTRKNRFVKLTPTPKSLELGKQHLPASFTRGNRHINPGKIVLVDKNRAEWLMNLKVDKRSGLMYIISANGWKRFCAANEVAAGETLTLELIQRGTTPLLKVVSEMEQPPFVSEARPYKRARWSRKSKLKHDVMQKTAEERVVHAPTISLSDDTEDVSNLSHNEGKESDNIGESSRKEKGIEVTVKTSSDQFSSEPTCFSQTVTAFNLSRDLVTVPTSFVKQNGLSKGRHEIVLMNREGKSWESEVKCTKSGQVFL